MKTCLVTGGAGFIGSHLVGSLLGKFRVICIDNLSSGSRKNIEGFLAGSNFTFIEHDVREKAYIKGDIDYIFHLASRASPKDFSRFPLDILMTNSLGTYNMLELAREKKARFLLASTSEVYGEPLEHPQREEYFGNVNTLGPRACYDEGKRAAEAITMAFHRASGVDARIARIFNTYGPNMREDDGRVIPNFVRQALGGREITVYGNGTQTRSFCYVDDMVRGLEKLMFTEGLPGQVFNLGSDKEMDVLEIARTIKAITQSQSEIAFSSLPKDDPTRRKPDISKAARVLGWKPEVGLEEGLRIMIRHG